MPMIIPPESLQPETLRAVLEEFVTRDGTDTADADVKLKQVRRQLKTGQVVLVFDEEQESCTIIRREDAQNLA